MSKNGSFKTYWYSSLSPWLYAVVLRVMSAAVLVQSNFAGKCFAALLADWSGLGGGALSMPLLDGFVVVVGVVAALALH